MSRANLPWEGAARARPFAFVARRPPPRPRGALGIGYAFGDRPDIMPNRAPQVTRLARVANRRNVGVYRGGLVTRLDFRVGARGQDIPLMAFFEAIQRTLRIREYDLMTTQVEVRFLVGEQVVPRTFRGVRFAEGADAFNEFFLFVNNQLQLNPTRIGSDPLIGWNQEEDAAIQLDTTFFGLTSVNLQVLDAEGLINAPPRGPRSNVFTHPSNPDLPHVWYGVVEEHYHRTHGSEGLPPDDGLCVVRAAGVYMRSQRAALDLFVNGTTTGEDSSEWFATHWTKFVDLVEHEWGMTLLLLDPFKIGVNIQRLYTGGQKEALRTCREGGFTGTEHHGYCGLLPLHTVLEPGHRLNGPFDGVSYDAQGIPQVVAGGTLPILFQHGHVDVPLFNPDTGMLRPIPDQLWYKTQKLNVAKGTPCIVVKRPKQRSRVDRLLDPLMLSPNPLLPDDDDHPPAIVSNVDNRFTVSTPYLKAPAMDVMYLGHGKTLIMAFDYETCMDPASAETPNVPILLTVAYADEQALLATDRSQEEQDEWYAGVYDRQTRVFYNKNGNREFLKWLMTDPMFDAYDDIRLVSFNGARFDNYLLLMGVAQLAQQEAAFDPVLTNLHQSGSKIFDFKFLAGKASLFDLALHCPGSLKKTAKSFGVPERYRKIEEHVTFCEVQAAYAEFGEDVWTRGPEPIREGFVEYGRMDSMCTLLLYRNFRNAQLELNMGDLKPTIAQQAMADFRPRTKNLAKQMGADRGSAFGAAHTVMELKQLKIMGFLPKLPTALYLEMRHNLVAGAVKLPKGPHVIRGQELMSLDETSQYPTSMLIMANSWFPAGLLELLPEGQEPRRDREGWYVVNVSQKQVWEQFGHVIHPYKQMGETRNNVGEKIKIPLANHWEPNVDDPAQPESWSRDVVLEEVGVMSATYWTMVDFGCPLQVVRAWEWRSRVRGCDLFTGIKVWMDKKNAIDQQPPAQRNNALREMCKLLMNSLSGKMCQKPYTDATHLAEKYMFYKDLERVRARSAAQTNGGPMSLSIVGNLVGKYILYETHISLDQAIQKSNQYPLPWGMKIYDLSRMRMFRTVYAHANKAVLYSDTDSAKGLRADFGPLIEHLWQGRLDVAPEILRENPGYAQWPLYDDSGAVAPKAFGRYENEMEGMATNSPNALWVAVCKKTWAYWDGVNAPKIGTKGIRKSDVWFRDKDDMLAYVQTRDRLATREGEYAAQAYSQKFYEEAPAERTVAAAPELFAQLVNKEVEYIYCLSFSMAHIVRGTTRRGAYGTDMGAVLADADAEADGSRTAVLYNIRNTYRVKRQSLASFLRAADVDDEVLTTTLLDDGEERPLWREGDAVFSEPVDDDNYFFDEEKAFNEAGTLICGSTLLFFQNMLDD